jgi:hypothetical protein
MGQSGHRKNRKQESKKREAAEPGSETERFRAIVDLRHNEAVTGESGVPRRQRDHELRRQLDSLDEFGG